MSVDERNGRSKSESKVASELREFLDEVQIGADFSIPSSAELCYSLELFLPDALRRDYPEWSQESIDGFFFAYAKKTGHNRAQLAGTCILITDQTVTPFYVDVELSSGKDSMTAYEVRLGEPGRGLLGVSGPPCNSDEARDLLEGLKQRLNSVQWVFHVSRCGGPGAP